MKNVLLICLMVLGCVSAKAQFDIWPPNLMIHDSLGNERKLDFAFQEGYNAALFYYWASWCPPCREKIEAMRPYAKSWRDEYNVKIQLIVYDRQGFSDSLLSVNYWRNYNLEEVGDLFFVHKEDADSAHFEIDPWNLTPWGKNYLHRASDGRLIAQLGSSAEDMDNVIRQHFTPVSAAEAKNDLDHVRVLQDDQQIHLLFEDNSGKGTLQMYDLGGQMIRSEKIENALSEVHISKSGLLRNQIYILKLTGDKNGVLKIYIK